MAADSVCRTEDFSEHLSKLAVAVDDDVFDRACEAPSAPLIPTRFLRSSLGLAQSD